MRGQNSERTGEDSFDASNFVGARGVFTSECYRDQLVFHRWLRTSPRGVNAPERHHDHERIRRMISGFHGPTLSPNQLARDLYSGPVRAHSYEAAGKKEKK